MASPIISANYEALQKVAQGFANQQQAVQRLQNDLVAVIDPLRRGGWTAEAATRFYNVMDRDVFRSLQRLNLALGHTQTATLAIISVFRIAEEEAAATLRGEGGASGGAAAFAGAALGAGAASASPSTQSWNTMVDKTDGGWNGAPPGQAKVIAVNGIQTDYEGMQGLMRETSAAFGNAPVLSIFNDTAGIGTYEGFKGDLKQSVADKFQVWFGFRPGPENPAVDSLARAIRATNGETPILAHSQGGAITAAALWKLHDEGFDLTHLKVTTMGSAEFDFPTDANSPQYEHHVHLNDVVPMLAGGKLFHYAFNPLTLATDYLKGEVSVVPVKIDGIKNTIFGPHFTPTYTPEIRNN